MSTMINDFIATLNLNSLAGRIEFQTESIVSQTLLTDPAGTVTLFAFDQGQGISEHTAPFDATVHILEGEVEIRVDGQPMVAIAGQQVTMPAHHPHALQAIQPFKMLLVMVKV